MQYANPELLMVAAALAGAFVGLTALEWLRRFQALRQLAAPGALSEVPFPTRRLVRSFLLLTASGLAAFAVLGPQWGEPEADMAMPLATGRDLLFLLDVSRSMQAADVSPNRLLRAKEDIHDLAHALEKRGGHRVGLIAFADRAALFCPLTTDYRAFEEELKRVSLETLRQRSDSGQEGTQIGAALSCAVTAVDHPMDPWTDLVLLSDGGDPEGDVNSALAELVRRRLPVHAVGLGDPLRESPIPTANGYLRYQGEMVRTRLVEEPLRQIAQQTGGHYLAVGTGYLELDRWYDGLSAEKQRREATGLGLGRHLPSRYQVFVLAAVGLLLLQMMVRDARGLAPAAPDRRRYFPWRHRRRLASLQDPRTGEESP